jgi:hypothetical protein
MWKHVKKQLTGHGTVVCVTHIDSRLDVSLQSARVVSKTAIRARSGAIKAADGAQVDRQPQTPPQKMEDLVGCFCWWRWCCVRPTLRRLEQAV